MSSREHTLRKGSESGEFREPWGTGLQGGCGQSVAGGEAGGDVRGRKDASRALLGGLKEWQSLKQALLRSWIRNGDVKTRLMLCPT